MKNVIKLHVLFILLHSCTSKEMKPDDIKNIQEIFKIKGNVKEIQEKIVTENFYYFSTTTFDRNGNPIETIQYDKNGKIKSSDPWIKLTDEELKQIKVKKEYDHQQRLVKQIEYSNSGTIETEFRYNSAGKKSEEIRKFGDRKIQSLFDSNGFLKEFIISILEDNKFYEQGREKYIYNKGYLIEKHSYNNQNENKISSKELYQYDNVGSLIKTTTYYHDSNLPEIKNRKIIYY